MSSTNLPSSSFVSAGLFGHDLEPTKIWKIISQHRRKWKNICLQQSGIKYVKLNNSLHVFPSKSLDCIQKRKRHLGVKKKHGKKKKKPEISAF